jgi:dolichyl-phosphate beta-glucosyltransferase
MLAARGKLLLFADADGATPIAEESRLAAAMQSGADIAVGSRLLPAADRQRARRWFRGLVGRLFAVAARRLMGLKVRDTQCGFKMFRGEEGRMLFAHVEEPRFLFDLEVLVLAQRFGCRVVEVPISWHEVPGSHFRLAQQFPQTLVSLWQLHRRLRS